MRVAILGVAVLSTLACTRAPEPATAPTVASEPERAPVSQADSPAPAAASEPVPASEVPAPESAAAPGPEVKTASTGGRACANGERLDSGCVCRSGGACFDICCGEDAGCAHPARPGGPSACLLKQPEPAAPRKCKDGDALASGCRCDGDTCMDICCVGSACSHHSSPDGGWAKCVNLPKRGR